MFLFGMTAEEVDALWRRGYDPHDFMTPELERVMRMLTSGVLGQRFDDIYASLLTNRFGTPDSYMTIADFQSYAAAQKRASETYLDRFLRRPRRARVRGQYLASVRRGYYADFV